MSKIRLAMLVSGSGTTAEFIFKACQEKGDLFGLIEPVCLIASAEGVGAIERLQKAGFKGRISVCNPRTLGKKLGDALCQELHDCEVDWFGQYGWLPMTPVEVIENFHGINQHPAPVPYFGGKGMYGLAPHAAVIEFRRLAVERMEERQVSTEATAQLVAKDYDEGPIIAWTAIPVLDGDTAESLQKELLPLEWRTQVKALDLIARNGGNPTRPVESSFELLEEEEDLLVEAKKYARKQYPHG